MTLDHVACTAAAALLLTTLGCGGSPLAVCDRLSRSSLATGCTATRAQSTSAQATFTGPPSMSSWALHGTVEVYANRKLFDEAYAVLPAGKHAFVATSRRAAVIVIVEPTTIPGATPGAEKSPADALFRYLQSVRRVVEDL